jgi:hypothetical protein
MGLELWRQSSLQVGSRDHEVDFGACGLEFLEINWNFPVHFLFIEGGQNKGLIEIAGGFKAVNCWRIDLSHIPKASDASQYKRQQEE